jgi:hypothetical protein
MGKAENRIKGEEHGMSLQNQVIIEWIITKHHDDVSFAERLEHVVKTQ